MLGLIITSVLLSIAIGMAIAQTFHKEGVTPLIKVQLTMIIVFGAILMYAINVQLLYANWYKLPIISIVLAVIASVKFHRHLLKENNNGQVW